jgi:hypothetical protein
VICIYCAGPLTEVRTDSPWEFDLWCEPCVKHIGTASYAHDQEPPTLRGVLESPPSVPGVRQGALF